MPARAAAWFEFIEDRHHPHRRYSGIGCLSPIKYERRIVLKATLTDDLNPKLKVVDGTGELHDILLLEGEARQMFGL